MAADAPPFPFPCPCPRPFLEAEYSLSYTSILRMDKQALAHDIPMPKLDGVEGILIDEKHLGAGKGFATLVVNAATGEPLEMAPGRDAHCLSPFFGKLKDSQKKPIRYLGIDRANDYKAASSRHLPHIKVCYDAYHLASNMNETLESIRRSTMQHPPYPLWQLMKGKRYVLLRGREKIDRDAKETLRQLSQLNRKLYIAYLLKEQFRQVFQTKDGNRAALRLILWIKMCMKSKARQLEAFARGISSKFNGVANGIRYGITPARIESSNATIKRIQVKACGMADMGYYSSNGARVTSLGCNESSKCPLFFYQQI